MADPRATTVIPIEGPQEKAPPFALRSDAIFDGDYGTRNGYNPDYLGRGRTRVGLPVLSARVLADAVPLLAAPNERVLKYQNYSVVMHKGRRLAIFSAANVSYGGRFKMSRPADVWRRDPRIDAEYQIENSYYTNNAFDRGHLTRREDMEYGETAKMALQCAADTCHWTNCTPQHSQFNQNKEIWQGIENYILEASIMNGHLNAQIMTGPVLDERDPEYKDVKYPVEFWKVVAALDDRGKLFATAYLASQADAVAKHGLEKAVVPFGPYKTFQTKISEIERITGLQFVCGASDSTRLKNHDPLEVNPPHRRPSSASKSNELAPISSSYREIRSLEDIHFKFE